ncbi:DUF6624 domain-containing protein [Streptomyces sp. NPDC093111]|uniref:DUF6624 domain-containing protein n=1 Tax=Streptomyces sp. NPDC093111 TaxID=3154978 RepID=UPI003433029A
MTTTSLSHSRTILITHDARRPDIAEELIVRAARADEHWSRLVRGRLSDAEIGRGRQADFANAEVLRQITDAHGWPGWAFVGEAGARAAWRIALRADNQPPYQRHAERLMYRAVRLSEASVRQWAHLHDRCDLQRGAAQVYGTQYRNGPAGPEREPVCDPNALDARRAEVGLPPADSALEDLRRRLATGLQADEATVELMSVG